MISGDTAYEVLKAANPAPVRAEVSRQSADEALAAALGTIDAPLRQVDEPPAWQSNGPLVAAVAFGIVVLVGLVAMVLLGEANQVIDEPVPTTIPSVSSTSSAPVPSSTVGGSALDVPPESLAIVDEFARAYSSGDYDILQATAPGLSFAWNRASDPAVPWTEQELQARFEIDAALETRLSFDDCQQLVGDRVSCVVIRDDALVRAVEIDPPRDVRWRLEIQNGAVVAVEELTPDAPRYYNEVRRPFQQWLEQEHPEVENPDRGFVGTPWRTDTDFAELAADLVAEWAATLDE